MCDRISAAGVAEGFYSGNQVTHLARGKGLHGDTLKLKNTDFLDAVNGPVGFEYDGIPWLYLSMKNAQMNNGAAVRIIMRVENQRL